MYKCMHYKDTCSYIYTYMCVCLYTYIHMYEKCSDKFTCLVLYRRDRSIHSAFSVDLYCFT